MVLCVDPMNRIPMVLPCKLSHRLHILCCRPCHPSHRNTVYESSAYRMDTRPKYPSVSDVDIQHIWQPPKSHLSDPHQVRDHWIIPLANEHTLNHLPVNEER